MNQYRVRVVVEAYVSGRKMVPPITKLKRAVKAGMVARGIDIHHTVLVDASCSLLRPLEDNPLKRSAVRGRRKKDVVSLRRT